MKRIVVAALTAASMALAGLPAHADEFTLDLIKVNPATQQGQAAIKLWKMQVADAFCGPVHMRQPLDLAGARAKCQAAVMADAQARIDAAAARHRQTALTYRVDTAG